GFVVWLAGGVVFTENAARSVVVEVLPAASRVACGDEVPEVIVLIAPRFETAVVDARRLQVLGDDESARRIRFDIQDHATQTVVLHPAGDWGLARAHPRDARGLSR